MKLTKRMLALFMALLCVVFAVPVSAAETDAVEKNPIVGDFRLKYDEAAGSYTVTGLIGASDMYAPVSAAIPPRYNSVPVTTIAKEAFKECGNLVEITIPATVETVNELAFRSCTNLKKATFLGTNAEIGIRAFAWCDSLTTVVLPSELTTVSEKLFEGCSSLKDIAIPSTVTSIGAGAFSGCSSLTSVTVPAGVTEIGSEAFAACSSLEEIILEDGNTAYKVTDGVLFTADGKTLLQYPPAMAASDYNIPDTVESIDSMAFAKSSKLSSVTFGSSVKTVGEYAFSEAAALSELNLNSGLETIGTMAFQRCSSLKTVTIPATVTSFDSAFFASGLEEVIIEDGVEAISANAFDSCSSLKSVEIPASVTAIGAGAFRNCTALEPFVIPSTVTALDPKAFVGNYILTLDAGSYSFADGSKSVKVVAGSGDSVADFLEELDTTGCIFGGWSADGKTVFNGVMPEKDITLKPLTKSYVELLGTDGEVTIDYRSSLKAGVKVNALPEGASLAWYNGTSKIGEGETVTIDEIKNDFTLVLKIVNADGSTVKNADGKDAGSELKVNVKAGFFKKIIAFFKGLFHRLPLVDLTK